MNEDKRERILELLSDLDTNISKLLHMIEEDPNILDATFDKIDKYIGIKIDGLIYELKNEVYYS